MKRWKWIALLFTCVAVTGGQDYGVPGEYLSLNFPSASAMGIGGGSTALTNNSDALYVNPAGIGYAQYIEYSLSYARFGTGLNYYPAGFCAPLGKIGSVGISYVGHLSPEAPGYDNFGIQRSSYRAGANSINFAYARSLLKVVSLGGSLRIATQHVATYSGAGIGMDLGIQVKPFPWVAAGAAFIDMIAPELRLNIVDVSYGTTFRAGVGIRPLYPFMSSERAQSLTLSFDGMVEDCFSDEKDYSGKKVSHPKRVHGGITFEPLEFLILRAGANDRLINMGFGISVRGVSTDAAIGFHHSTDDMDLGPDFSFGIRYEMGRPLSTQQQDVDLREKAVSQKETLAKVHELYIQGSLVEARDLLTSYCSANPKDNDAAKFLSDIEKQISQKNADKLVIRALSDLEKGNTASASKLIDQAIALDPKDSTANALKRTIVVKNETSERLKKVATLFETKKYDEMERELNIIQSLDSLNGEVSTWRQKIGTYLKKRDAERLVASASKSYYEDHDVEKASNDLQSALSLDSENKDAQALYEKLSREIKEVYLKKVGHMVEGQNLAASETDLKKLVALDVKDRIIRVRRLIDDQQFEQALSEIKTVLRDSPDDTIVKALNERAENGKRMQQSANTYEEALKLYNEGNVKEAEARIKTAVALDTNNVKARNLQVDIKKKNCQVNLDIARVALDKDTKTLLDQALIKIEEYIEADSSSDTAKQLSRDIRAQLLVLDANSAIESGDYERAQGIIQDALRISPDNRKVQEAYKNLRDAMEALQ